MYKCVFTIWNGTVCVGSPCSVVVFVMSQLFCLNCWVLLLMSQQWRLQNATNCSRTLNKDLASQFRVRGSSRGNVEKAPPAARRPNGGTLRFIPIHLYGRINRKLSFYELLRMLFTHRVCCITYRHGQPDFELWESGIGCPCLYLVL